MDKIVLFGFSEEVISNDEKVESNWGSCSTASFSNSRKKKTSKADTHMHACAIQIYSPLKMSEREKKVRRSHSEEGQFGVSWQMSHPDRVTLTMPSFPVDLESCQPSKHFSLPVDSLATQDVQVLVVFLFDVITSTRTSFQFSGFPAGSFRYWHFKYFY